MAGDRFKSPVVTAMARRQLAFDGSTVISSPIRAGQSILASPSKPVVQSPTSKLNFLQLKSNHHFQSTCNFAIFLLVKIRQMTT